jgi:phage baseplate assembly protein W
MATVKRADRYTPLEGTYTIYQDLFTKILFEKDTKDAALISNEDAVKQAIINIILTNVGERLYNPTLGSEINKMLFENVTPQTTATLINLIKSAINNYEPRANLIDVVASPLPDENAYTVSIVFSVINKTEPIYLEFLLNRVR